MGHQPPYTPLSCDELLETLVSANDKPYEYNHILATLLCDAIRKQSQGFVEFVDGVPMMEDPNRGKMLSLARPIIRAAYHGHNISDRYLEMDDVPSQALQGFYLPRAATITGLWGKSRSNGSWTLEVRRNGVQLTVASTIISGGFGSSPNVDIDVDAGDWIQIFASGSGIAFPIAKVELAWRG